MLGRGWLPSHLYKRMKIAKTLRKLLLAEVKGKARAAEVRKLKEEIKQAEK